MDAITKNQMIPGRRAVLRIAAVLGTVGLTRLLTAGEAHTPGRPATEGPPGAPRRRDRGPRPCPGRRPPTG